VPVLALLAAVLTVALEQLIQWKYGVLGVLGLTLLTIGFRTRSPACSSAGAAVLAVLVTSPAF
jgi:hypothetical protein